MSDHYGNLNIYGTITVGDLQSQISNNITSIQGRYQLNSQSNTFTISHIAIDENVSYPVCSLEVASDNSDLYIVGIHSRTSTNFKVTLSNIPNSNTYLLWHLSSPSSIVIPSNFDNYTPLSTTSEISGNLQSQIDNIIIPSNLDSYTPLVTTANISGNLQSQINSYTPLVTTANISGNLQSQIDNISLSNLGIGLVKPISSDYVISPIDNGCTIVCTSTPKLTINNGLLNGFGLSIKGTFTVDITGSATTNDVRTSGISNPWCALIQIGNNTYDLVGGKV